VRKLLAMLLVLGALAALLLAYNLAVPVTRCTVQGISRYTVGEFAAAMELNKRQVRLHKLDKPLLARKIHATLPYVRVTAVKRGLGTLRLEVEELPPVFAQEQDGHWWLLAENGKLLERVSKQPEGLLTLSGARLQAPKAGAKARWVNRFTAPGDPALLLAALRESSLWKNITGLRVSTAALPEAVYQDRIRLRFDAAFSQSGADSLELKLETAVQYLLELDAENPEYRGILDASTPGRAYFSPLWEEEAEDDL